MTEKVQVKQNLNARIECMQIISKLKKVGSSLSREMPSMCGLCHQDQTTGIILQVLCRHYPRRDQA